jgi:hypothetical protein
LVLGSAEQRLELNRASFAEIRGGERKGMYCHVGVPTSICELVPYSACLLYIFYYEDFYAYFAQQAKDSFVVS